MMLSGRSGWAQGPGGGLPGAGKDRCSRRPARKDSRCRRRGLCRTSRHWRLSRLREAKTYQRRKEVASAWDYLKSLTPLALTIWYMDDGSFTVRSKGVQERTAGSTGRIEICVEAMSAGSRDRLVRSLADTYGLEVRLTSRGVRQVNVLRFTTAASEKFQRLVAPYIHPSMDYELLPRFRGQFAVEPEFMEPTICPVPARVLDIRRRKDFPIMSRYDIEVEGSHNYLADGIIVHNGPETTSGGKALKFYASIRWTCGESKP